MKPVMAPGGEVSPGEQDGPVLVVVVNRQADLDRARDQGWYRIPVAHLPARVAADYLAFYQTGAFPPAERWAVRWLAPVHAYHLTTRRALIPEEPAHPRADAAYYKVVLGPLQPLPHLIPSRRLRRITFIPTTLARLYAAEEINDLWIKSTAQERLWLALKQAGVDAERQYELDPDLPDCLADFAVPGYTAGVALLVDDEPGEPDTVAEQGLPDYRLAAAGWRVLHARRAELEADPGAWVGRLVEEAGQRQGQ